MPKVGDVSKFGNAKGGRPKGRKNNSTIAREKALAEGYQKMVDAYSGSVQKLIDLAESTSDEALKAKILMDLLDRVGGKAKQAVDLDARVDGTVEIAPVSAEEKIKRLKELAKAFEK